MAASILGLALNAPPRKLFVSMAAGAAVWSIALTGAVHFGLADVRSLAG
jgi:uncharacterized membrane protein YjjB (DUF3815 family)